VPGIKAERTCTESSGLRVESLQANAAAACAIFHTERLRKMPVYAEDALDQIEVGALKVYDKYVDLFMTYLNWPFADPFAEKMARQGFLRRLKTLAFCVREAFATIPPGADAIPSDTKLQQCTVCIQAFVFNVFGCMDNLAHLWIRERGIKQANGNDIPLLRIGLGEKCKDVRKSLSQDFQEYLSSERMKTWFKYHESYRHALAHRIPLYIPPHGVKQSDVPAYEELERQKSMAMARVEMDEYQRLDKEQKKLAVFQPFMQHSWDEISPIMYFHAQLLADYETVVDFGRRMLKELDRPKAL